MPCYHPLKALRNGSGGVSILDASAAIYHFKVPCGQCVGCRLERSRQWAVRCVHEASLHEQNCFVTLTYNDDNLPSDGGLVHNHFQLFMKRLRRSFPNRSIRFYMCGEYGELNRRPHYHACLFNCDFNDKIVHSITATGYRLFRSDLLSRLWPFGFSTIGDVTFETAAYTARYVMKKITGDLAADHYRNVNTETGEIYTIRPEYNKMSLKPAIGKEWFDQFCDDVYPDDFVVTRGSKSKPPRYYDKLLKRIDEDTFDKIKSDRILDFHKHIDDNTYTRLAVKEVVTNAKLSSLKRTI